MNGRILAWAASLVLGSAGEAFAQASSDRLGATCQTPPPAHCPAAGECPVETLREAGNAIDPKTGRKFFLDYPCDLKPDEKLVFILNLHGAGSNANWQRHYFPAFDVKDRYRLVIATPVAATNGVMIPGNPPVRMWAAQADDAHLRNIVDEVYDAFGPANIRAFWIAGHSQGGMTANRIVCSSAFRGRVTGWLSLSGGRIGPVKIDQSFFPAPPPGAGASRLPQFPIRATIGAAATPACDLNYIFETGRNEIQDLPSGSPWADRYGCGRRTRQEDVVDDRAGYVFDTRPQGPPRPAWGGRPRPGTAQVMIYPNCRSGRLVADVVRQGKGHTEGLEPRVTEAIVRMMVEAPAG